MRYYKKIIASLLVGMIACLCCVTSLADGGTTISPFYDYTHNVNAGISIAAENALCTAVARCKTNTYTIRLSMTLQCRQDGTTSWVPMKTWSTSTSGKYSASLSKNQSVSRGYDYRVYVRSVIVDSEGVVLETASAYSKTFYY
jgi:hypothetical protein